MFGVIYGLEGSGNPGKEFEMWEKKLKYVFIGMGAVLLVVVVTIGCAFLGLVITAVVNNEDRSFMGTGMGLGEVVGFGLAIVSIMVIKILRDWWISRESNKQKRAG
ncbi:MAG: hypothetical protein IMF11_00185 [Proteobacteria bacterium]|nr:hypothetical protein [Pseudomonadota bacterium]